LAVSSVATSRRLTVAAALEDTTIHQEFYDLANEGGFRFAGDENRWSGKLAELSEALALSIPGYSRTACCRLRRRAEQVGAILRNRRPNKMGNNLRPGH
jgi:hypothetical protein